MEDKDQSRRKSAGEAQTGNDGSSRVAAGNGSVDQGSVSGPSTATPKLYHTLTACTRCRSRKTRCDAGLPKCGPCERSGAQCEFFDAAKQRTISRSYVVRLQAKVRELEAEVAKKEALLCETEIPDSAELVREIGMVKFGDEPQIFEPRFVGTSSGITMTRLVLDFAKKHLESGSVQEITEQHKSEFRHAQRINSFEKSPLPNELSPGTTVAIGLPPRRVTNQFVDMYLQKAQFLLPLLHEPTFLKYVDDVYNGDADPVKLFQLKIVLAIAMQKLSHVNPDYTVKADSYYLAAFEHLEDILEPMDMTTLQCVALMASYSLLTPTRTAVYHVVGIAVRLCIQLGYSQEKTIMHSVEPLDPITADLRRRLFWVVASFEYGLSHVLGRPSGFATMDAYVDVKFYEMVDDKYITANGVLPGPQSIKKQVSRHFFKLRRLQAQIRQALYQNPKEEPKDDKHPWFNEMLAKIEAWNEEAPVGGGLQKEWFTHRYHNMIIFLFRPSPQIPQPSLEATFKCYDTAIKNVPIQKKMFEEKLVDISFVFIYQIFMTVTTMIWALCSEEIRKVHPKEEVKGYLESSLSTLRGLQAKWPGTEAAIDVYEKLANAALRSYHEDEKKKMTSQLPAPLSTSDRKSERTSPKASHLASPRLSSSSMIQAHPSNPQPQSPPPHSSVSPVGPISSSTVIPSSATMPSVGENIISASHTAPDLLQPVLAQNLQNLWSGDADGAPYGIFNQMSSFFNWDPDQFVPSLVTGSSTSGVGDISSGVPAPPIHQDIPDWAAAIPPPSQVPNPLANSQHHQSSVHQHGPTAMMPQEQQSRRQIQRQQQLHQQQQQRARQQRLYEEQQQRQEQAELLRLQQEQQRQLMMILDEARMKAQDQYILQQEQQQQYHRQQMEDSIFFYNR